MTLQTWVARFVVDHGKVTEEGGRLRTFQRRRLDEPEVDLHVLAEPEGAKGDELGAQAVEAIGRAFLSDRLSLTGGLIKAMHTTHQTLLDWNRRSVPRDQVSVGIAAAVVNGNVVYLAQTGPSLIFHRTGHRTERITCETEGASPLGEGAAEPELRRYEMTPGELLLVASPSLEEIVDRDHLEELLDRGSDQALPELYLLARERPNFALFLITCLDLEDEEAPPPPIVSSGIDERDPYGVAIAPREDEPRRPGRRLFGALDGSDAGEEEVGGRVAVLTAPAPLDISRPIVRLRGESAIARGDYTRTTGSAPRLRLSLGQRWIAIIAIATAVVVFLGAVAVPDLIKQGRSEKVGTLITNAQGQLSQSTTETDPGRRRTELEETRRLTTEALRLDSKSSTASDLNQQAANALKQMDAVIDLGQMTTLTTLGKQITGDVSIDGMAIAGGAAYLLDSKGGRVLAVPLNGPGAPTAVYQDGDSYGNTSAKKPMFVTWDTSNGGRLLILDAERKLYQIRPGNAPEPLPLRRTNTWSSVAGIAAYDGNFYVLDPKGNQIHRYLPASNGFDSEPTLAVSNASLANAVTFSVDADIYVVMKAGQVQRYHSGSDAGFALGGIDRPVKTVTGLTVIAATDEVYLADTSAKRIVVAGRDGTFHRQLVSNAFTDLRAIGLDPNGGQIYIVVGDALLTAPVPRQPPPIPPPAATITPTP